MPHAARWRCLACGRELGTVRGPMLALDGVPVLVKPGGTVIAVCPACRGERTWTPGRREGVA